jgi:membrane-bound serine protease (ClpP class)
MAAHVAAMAPTTRIGAATPVDGGGQEIPEDLRTKIVNDAVVYARSIADARDRNADWAEDAVRDAVVVGADEALSLDIVDLVADDRDALLAEIDGTTVTTTRGEVVLETAGAAVVEEPMSPFERLFMAIASPDIALLLLSLGGLALYFELANPGAIFPGVVGVIFLVLAFVSLGTLPISAAGLALLLIGMVLLGAEIFVASGGILGVGGVAAFALGGLLLIDDAQAPFLEVSRPLIIGLTLTMGGFVLFAMRAVVRARTRPVTVGGADLIGRIGRVRGRDVHIAGERWRAEGPSGERPDLPADAAVRIVGRRGLVLQVEPVDPAPPPSSTDSQSNG